MIESSAGRKKRRKHFGKGVNRLAIWRDERLDRHVNQAKHMVCGFYPRINNCDFADWRRDLTMRPARADNSAHIIHAQRTEESTPYMESSVIRLSAVSILGFENCQSFFSYNCPCTYGVPQCAAHRNARSAPV